MSWNRAVYAPIIHSSYGHHLLANVSWQRTYATRNDSKGIVSEVEHILSYSKQPNWNPHKLARTSEMDDRYSSPDNDPRPWKAGDASAPGASNHPGMVYAIQHPITGYVNNVMGLFF